MDNLALRTLYLTVSAFCLLMFIHFTTVITAEMTSGPAAIPVNNFGDVLELGYNVIYQGCNSIDIFVCPESGPEPVRSHVWSFETCLNL